MIRPIRSLTLALAVAGMAGAGLLAATADARPGGGGCEGHGDRGLERRLEALDLDDETRTQVFAIVDGAAPAQRELRAQIHAAHEEMRALLDAAEVDEETLMAQQDQIAALRGESKRLELHTLLAVRELLTPEQRAALKPRRHHGYDGGPPAPPSSPSSPSDGEEL